MLTYQNVTDSVLISDIKHFLVTILMTCSEREIVLQGVPKVQLKPKENKIGLSNNVCENTKLLLSGMTTLCKMSTTM